MAQFKMNYVSDAVKDKLNLYITIPQEKHILSCSSPMRKGNSFVGDYPVLILLHDEASSPLELLANTSVSRYAEENGVILIVPDGQLSFFTDYAARDRSSNNFGTGNSQIESSFTELCFEQAIFEAFDLASASLNISSTSAQTYIGGIGMGGFGAVRTAMAYPDRFAKVFSISGYLDLQWIMDHCPERKEQFEAIFGGLKAEGKNDLVASTLANASMASPPSILQIWNDDTARGTMNRYYAGKVAPLYPKHIQREEKETFSWSFVDRQLQQSLEWLGK